MQVDLKTGEKSEGRARHSKGTVRDLVKRQKNWSSNQISQMPQGIGEQAAIGCLIKKGLLTM